MTSNKVTRLPAQHRTQPHCADCKKPMPNFQSMHLSFGLDDLRDCQLLFMVFRVRCSCGSEWDLRKEIKQ